MKDEDLKFYELMRTLAHEEKLRQIDREVIETANRPKQTKHFDEQEKIVKKKNNSKKTYRIKSGALTFLMVLGFATGVGAKTTYDAVAPIVKTYVQNEADNISLVGWIENFNASKTGYFLDMKIKKVTNDEPKPYDYSDPDNLTVTADGRKVGAIVDYYEAFDEYLEESIGTGYYQIKYEQMQRLVSIGKDPNSVDCIYSYEELSKMLSDDKSMGVE